MPDVEKKLMPEEIPHTEPGADSLTGAIVSKIVDDTEDSKTLRNYRPCLAKALATTATIFYVILLMGIISVIWCPTVTCLAVRSQTVCITILVILAVIPTLLVFFLARAVFGKRAQIETPLTPLNALVQLMRDMKSN